MPGHSDFLKHPAARDSTSVDYLYAAHGELDFGNLPWAEASARFLILRLSPFRDVERSTPHEFLFREVRSAMPDAYIDFGFFPAARDRQVLESGGVPLMHGLASARGALDFDVLLVSNSYTLELVNLAPFLAGSGVPVSRIEREASSMRGGVRYPIIVLGGSNAMASAAAFDGPSGDSLVDAVFFGEGEGRVAALARRLAAAARLAGEARLAELEAAALETDGFWPVAGRRSVTQAKARPGAYPADVPPTLAGEEAGTTRLEITRGCPSFCAFCFEGWERKPFRERPLDSIIAEAKRLKAGAGADTVELASYNFNAHSGVVDVIDALHRVFWSVSFQSQRVDILARSPGLVRFEVAAGKRSFTVGVEGVSERARAYFNKELRESDLKAVLERIVREGAREIKLFYILSGFEDDADLAEFSGFVSWLRDLACEKGSAPRVIFSAGELIRMPFTPLAYERLILDEAPFKAIRTRLESTVAQAGFEIRSPGRFDEYCLSQVLALAPEGSYHLLRAMAARGFAYDKTLSRGAWEFARSFLEERGALDEVFLGEKPRDYPFPYAFIQPVASRDIVYGRFLDARTARERASCLGADCSGCGACADPRDAGSYGDERAFLAAHRLDTVSERDLRGIEAVVAAKRKPFETFVRASVPREAASAPPAYAAALFRRGLFAAAPFLVDSVWTAADAFLKSKDGLERLPGAWGDTCYRLLSSSPVDPATLAAAGYATLDSEPAPDRLNVEVSFPAARQQEAVRLVSDFLATASIPYTLRNEGDGKAFIVSDKGKKKRNVLGAAVSASSDGSVSVRMICGSKYDLGALAALAGKRNLVMETGVRF